MLHTFLVYLTDKHEVNITDLIQEKLGNTVYTTILAQYANVPEQLLQWYVNGQPVGSTSTIFHVNQDGLNTYLRFKHDVNQTYGTFMLKVNGTKWKDSLKLPHPQQMSSLFRSPKTSLNKIVTKVVNGIIRSDVNAIPDSQSDRPTNRKYRPEIIGLGQDRKQQTKPGRHHISQDTVFSPETDLTHNTKKHTSRKFLSKVIRLGQDRKQRTNTPSHYVSQDSILSSETNLPLDKIKKMNRKFLPGVIRLGQDRKQRRTHLPVHKSHIKNIGTSSAQDGTFSSVIPSALGEL